MIKVVFKRSSIALLALTLLLPALVSSSQANEVTSLACKTPQGVADVGSLVIGAANQQLPTIEWGIRQGCFKKFGLTVKSAPVSSFPVGAAGIIGKSYDLYVTTSVNVIKSVADGSFAGKYVASKYGYTASELLRAKSAPFYPGELLMGSGVIVSKGSGIKTFTDLNNKKVAVLSIDGVDQAGILLYMREAGIRKPKTEFLALSNIQMADALKRGDVDAVVAIDPYASQIVKDGGEVIGYPQAYFQEPGPAVVFMSSAEIVNSKARTMRVFQKANLEINRLLNKPENEASLRQIIAEVTKVSPEIANKVRLSTMSETSITISQLAYLPSKLKRVGFMKGRFDLGPIIFK